jgi:hypothetical protein
MRAITTIKRVTKIEPKTSKPTPHPGIESEVPETSTVVLSVPVLVLAFSSTETVAVAEAVEEHP